MAGNDRKSGADPEGAGPSEEELAARLRALDRRLDDRMAASAGRGFGGSAGRNRLGNSGFAIALSLSGTFISAIVVGAGMGWAIDRYFGLAPWGMIVFTLLGFAAGVLNILRMSGHMPRPGGNGGGANGKGS